MTTGPSVSFRCSPCRSVILILLHRTGEPPQEGAQLAHRGAPKGWPGLPGPHLVPLRRRARCSRVPPALGQNARPRRRPQVHAADHQQRDCQHPASEPSVAHGLHVWQEAAQELVFARFVLPSS